MDLSKSILIHGDAIEVMKKIPNNSIDLVLTDPPYGHNNNDGDMISNREAIFGKNKVKSVPREEYRPILNDGEEANELFKQSVKEYARILKRGSCCCCCCCGGGGPDPQFARWSLLLDKEIPFKMAVVWDKGKMGMGHHYRRSYEFILVAQKKGNKCAWYDTTKKIENIIRPGYKGIKKIIPSKDRHPTEKPVALMAHFIQLHTNVGDIVLDPFAGSGTTLLAAKQLGRRYIGVELDNVYVDMANKRLNRNMLL